MKLVIIGGVAGGASAAARAARLDGTLQIKLFERGNYISFANCGLPYHLGKVIPERKSLMVMTPEGFTARTGAEVFVRHEVTAIHPDRHEVTVKNLDSGATVEESYDRLIIATGSSPLRPSLPGCDDPDVLSLWTIPDMDEITGRIDGGAKRALVVGGGFIGLETAENLRERGLDVTLVELMDQVLPTLDREMTLPLQQELFRLGIKLRLGQGVKAFGRSAAGVLSAELSGGDVIAADFAVMSVGVRPNSHLAVAAGAKVNGRGGVVVDAQQRTSLPDVYAVGDVTEVRDPIFGGATMIPLAGPANRQGRIAADHICGLDSAYPGTLGASIVKIGCLTAAAVGWTERRLQKEKHEYLKTYLHPASNAGYYPGFAPLHIKLLFARDGSILGAQIVGAKGVDKRIDVIATALRGLQKVADLAQLELSYAPPYGSARDPVNYAGMIAENIRQGLSIPVYGDAIPADAFLLDIREPAEAEVDRIPGSLLIPLSQLRQRLDELPRDRRIVTYCRVGLRGYVAERILRQHGFEAANLSGGLVSWRMFNPPEKPLSSPAVGDCSCNGPAATGVVPTVPPPCGTEVVIDVRAMACPGPVVRVRQQLDQLPPGGRLRILAAAGFRPDLEAWTAATGNCLVEMRDTADGIEAVVAKGGLATVPAAPAAARPDSATIVLFSNDLDKAMAAFIIANGMAAAGTRVSMFFTFWGLSVMRRDNPPAVRKNLLSRMFGWMLPRGATRLALSKMHMGGMGTAMMKYVMRQKNVSTLPQLIADARTLGVKFVACEMAMDVMGLQRNELLENIDEIAGVARFAQLTKESGTALFI
ncbi:MAG: FAD-dependent oxidoreductase [Victivallales bacterium]|nr:FAD-dependent oxidoreductase [Victivallales bacterium]